MQNTKPQTLHVCLVDLSRPLPRKVSSAWGEMMLCRRAYGRSGLPVELSEYATSARTALHAASRRTQPSPAAMTRPEAGRAASASPSCATNSGPFGSVAPFRCAAV